MADSKIHKPDGAALPEPDFGDAHEAIAQQYRSINEVVSRSHNCFQKLYNRKERLLLEGLHSQLELVRKELRHYEGLTSPEYIRQKCHEKKEQLQQQRFEMLRNYMELTDDLIQMRKTLREATQRLEETRTDRRNTHQMLTFLQLENDRLRAAQPPAQLADAVFATQPACSEYVSPYAKSGLLKETQKSGYRSRPKRDVLLLRRADAVLEDICRLYSSQENCQAYTRDPELNFVLAVLDLPEIRQNLIDILSAK